MTKDFIPHSGIKSFLFDAILADMPILVCLTYVNDSLYFVISAISEVAEGPAGVRQHLLVCVVDELGQGRQALLDCLKGWGRVLVATQVGQGPGHVAQKGSLP